MHRKYHTYYTLPDSVYGTTPNLFGDFSVDADTYNEQDAWISRAMSAAWCGARQNRRSERSRADIVAGVHSRS